MIEIAHGEMEDNKKTSLENDVLLMHYWQELLMGVIDQMEIKRVFQMDALMAFELV